MGWRVLLREYILNSEKLVEKKRLEFQSSFELSGNISSIQSVRLPNSNRDSFLLSFDPARVCPCFNVSRQLIFMEVLSCSSVVSRRIWPRNSQPQDVVLALFWRGPVQGLLELFLYWLFAKKLETVVCLGWTLSAVDEPRNSSNRSRESLCCNAHLRIATGHPALPKRLSRW